MVLLLIILLIYPGLSMAGNTFSTGNVMTEFQQHFGAGRSPFVVSDCTPAVPSSSLTIDAFACTVIVEDGSTPPRQIPAIQVAKAVGPLNSGDGTYWLATHQSTGTTVSGWTRQAGSHYLWKFGAAQPATPVGGLIFAEVTVAASVISAIEPLILSSPWARSLGVISITDPPFNAVGDDSTDNTTAIQAAINASERSGDDRICLRVPAGTFRHTGLSFTKGICIEGVGWGSVLKNTSTTNHSIGRLQNGTGDTETQAIRIANLKLTHTGTAGTDDVDGIHIEETSKFIEIHRVYVDVPPRDGIYIEGVSAVANGDSTYAMLTHNWVSMDSGARDSLSITGSANGGIIIGGRYDAVGRYGLSIADSDAAFPNSWFVAGIDLPGSCDSATFATCAPLFDEGLENSYFMLRFEASNAARPDILLGATSLHSNFFGNRHSTSANAYIDDSTAAASTYRAYGFDYSVLDPNHVNGFLGYYDTTLAGCSGGHQEIGTCRRDLPKRGRLTVKLEQAAAADATSYHPVMRCEDPLTITGAYLIPVAGMTGDNTDYVTLEVLVADGSTQAVSGMLEEDFTTGIDLTQYDAFDLLAATVGAVVNCDQDDVILFRRTKVASGLLMPELTLQLEWEGGEHTP